MPPAPLYHSRPDLRRNVWSPHQRVKYIMAREAALYGIVSGKVSRPPCFGDVGEMGAGEAGDRLGDAWLHNAIGGVHPDDDDA